jgi:hypothetical protein
MTRQGNGTRRASTQVSTNGGQSIPLASIKDGGAQMRVEMSVGTVNDYAEDMLKGAVFPPVIVYFDGTDYWSGDGFHRIEAARKIEREDILAEVRAGTQRDAILCGVSANSTHGLRRTQADKRRAVEKLLTDPEWARGSDRKIAEATKVDHKTVGKIRRELSGEIPTGKSNGEIPKAPAKANGFGSIFLDVLRAIPEAELIAECERRGLKVEAANEL